MIRAAGGGILAGILLWSFLPGTIARAMPESWHMDIHVDQAGGQHVEILQHFTNAILKGEKLLSPAAEGLHSVELANAIDDASNELMRKNAELVHSTAVGTARVKRGLAEMLKGGNFGKMLVRIAEDPT